MKEYISVLLGSIISINASSSNLVAEKLVPFTDYPLKTLQSVKAVYVIYGKEKLTCDLTGYMSAQWSYKGEIVTSKNMTSKITFGLKKETNVELIDESGEVTLTRLHKPWSGQENGDSYLKCYYHY